MGQFWAVLRYYPAISTLRRGIIIRVSGVQVPLFTFSLPRHALSLLEPTPWASYVRTMPWSYNMPAGVRQDLEVCIGAGPRPSSTEVWSVITYWASSAGVALPKAVPAEIDRLVTARLTFRAFGPADIWGDVVDWMNKQGIEPPNGLPTEGRATDPR